MAFLAFLALACGTRAQAETADWEARLTQAKGTVTVYTAEDPEGVPGEEDLPLEAGDRVTTGEESSAEVALDGMHLVVLQAHSDFTLAGASKQETEFKLTLGSLLAKFETLLAGQKARVRTPTAVASVRGTEFGVEIPAENPDETYVAVFDEGQVEVEGGEGPPERLKASQETRVARGARPQPAYQLSRLVRHRRFMRGYGARSRAVRKAWRSLPGPLRLQKRRELLQSLRGRRERRLEERRQRRDSPREPRRRVEDRPDRKKMEQRREEIRRRRRGP